jgi:hypothetical protein
MVDKRMMKQRARILAYRCCNIPIPTPKQHHSCCPVSSQRLFYVKSDHGPKMFEVLFLHVMAVRVQNKFF